MINKKEIKIVPVCILDNKFLPNEYYKTYYEYQIELRQVAPDIKDEPIEQESACIEHCKKYENYIDNMIYYKDKFVGLICYQVVDFLNDGLAPLLYIDHFYIKPEFRRKGIGMASMNHVLDKFSKFHIFFYVLKLNEPAKAFWSRFAGQNHVDAIIDDRCISEDEAYGYASNTSKYMLAKKENTNGK